MHSSSITLDSSPQWYRVEKDTENIIKKLTSIKELSLYLNNPDEYIRRLAVLRINELRLKDSVIYLKELLDDPLETNSNKELAAWTIKVICLHWNNDIFITNKYLNKYSGKEKYTDIIKINIKDELPSLKFDFTSSMFNTELMMENNEIRSSKEIEIDLPFSIKEWFSQYSSDILNDLKSIARRLPILLFKSLKFVVLLIVSVAIKAAKRIKAFISGLRLNSRAKKGTTVEGSDKAFPSPLRTYKYNLSQLEEIQLLRGAYNMSMGFEDNKKETLGLIKYIKKVVFYIFYVIFSPIRFINKHRKLALATAILLYCFFTFTPTGKILIYNYTGLDLMDEQIRIYYASKEILTYVIDEVQNLLGFQTL